ncbi:MAG TPA: TolC family protein [Cytophagales bacterium]|nr:TolC family protein [Cytophagales bacterium]
MKRRIKIILMLCTAVSYTYSQSDKLDSLESKLVDLALANYPTYKVSELRVKSVHKDIGIARSAWGENFIAQLNLTEAHIDPSSTAGTSGATAFYPRYLVGMRVTLGTFFKTPLTIKKAKFEHEIALKEMEQQKILIKHEVKRRFRIYIAKRENLLLRKQLTDEAKSQLNIVTKRYNNKEVPYEEYFQQSTNYLTLQESLNIAESEVYVSKYDLEELVGVDINGLE